MVVETSFAVPLYASASIAYDGTVYARVDVARWSRDCTSISEFLGLFNPTAVSSRTLVRPAQAPNCNFTLPPKVNKQTTFSIDRESYSDAIFTCWQVWSGRLRLNLNPLNLVRWIDSWPFDKTWKPGWIDSTWVNRFNGRAMNLERIFFMTPSSCGLLNWEKREGSRPRTTIELPWQPKDDCGKRMRRKGGIATWVLTCQNQNGVVVFFFFDWLI